MPEQTNLLLDGYGLSGEIYGASLTIDKRIELIRKVRDLMANYRVDKLDVGWSRLWLSNEFPKR
jgi:hypothetical protein